MKLTPYFMLAHSQGAPMIHLDDIHSLSEFQRNTRDHIEHLRATGRPIVLTVHGRAEVVVQSAEGYQRLLDLTRRAATIIGIQRGLQGAEDGTGEDVEIAFNRLEAELGISLPAE
jgi:prevent-host-death family protein